MQGWGQGVVVKIVRCRACLATPLKPLIMRWLRHPKASLAFTWSAAAATGPAATCIGCGREICSQGCVHLQMLDVVVMYQNLRCCPALRCCPDRCPQSRRRCKIRSPGHLTCRWWTLWPLAHPSDPDLLPAATLPCCRCKIRSPSHGHLQILGAVATGSPL